MGGPSAHGQRNKPHKPGRHAGKGARARHRDQKAGITKTPGVKRGQQNKEQRLAASKAARDAKRRTLLEARRQGGPPRLLGVLPLHASVDGPAAWQQLFATCWAAQAQAPDTMDAGPPVGTPLTPLSLGRAHKTTAALLPLPANRSDPLALVDVARAADMLVLVVPETTGELLDEHGASALAVLRALGLPSTVAAVATPPGVPPPRNTAEALKRRAAVKKHAAAELHAQGLAECGVHWLVGDVDQGALLRYVGSAPLSAPSWRTCRPSMLVEGVEAVDGLVGIRGMVRGSVGLSANQLIHLPGAGDYRIDRILAAQPPACPNEPAPRLRGDAMETEGPLGTQGPAAVLAQPDPEVQDDPQREHEADPLAGEQTWPTEEELREAEAAPRRPRLPRGTSAYQAAWLLDGEDYDTDLESVEEEEAPPQGVPLEEDGWEPMDDAGTDIMQEDDVGTEGTEDPSLWAVRKAQRAAEVEQEVFPDEVDTPMGVAARVRFGKYRGLKSWRSSPWDPKEALPQEYARVFAFEQFARAHKRARAAQEAAGSLTDVHGVAPGTPCLLVLQGVSPEAAAALHARVAAASQGLVQPPVAVGLLQHEAKLSVVHWGVSKAPGYERPLANKEELLFVTGVRTDDIKSDKHKMERFLHAGRPSVATVFAPICFPPMPLLAFKCVPGEGPQLAMTGSLRSCNPDRIILKKIVLSGYPVKVHKHKAIVKYMFHNPDDVRWFRALELWTKYGRRGRIREPVGTHGVMKCIFDGPIQQRDGVCLSLYKRVFPKWPQDMIFG